MHIGRSPWLALFLSVSFHCLMAIGLIAVSSDLAPARDATGTLDECILISDAQGGEAETAASQPLAVGGMPRQDSESDGAFSAVVKDLAPRGSTEESSLEGKENDGGASARLGVTNTARGQGHDGNGAYYGIAINGARVVYVVDRSLSMGLSGGYRQACEEMLDSLERLPAEARFQVVLYNRNAEPLTIRGSSALLPATADTKEQIRALVHSRRSEGSTDHMQAMRAVFRLHPDTIFLVTDGDGLTQQTAEAITKLNKDKCTIHVIEVTRWLEEHRSAVLKQLAVANGGRYRALAIKSH